ncbi:MAG TPA: trimeric intracellular cation channel family protein [Humisphaera sp.]
MPFSDLVSYLGVAVAAISGALAAGRRSFDLVGVIVLATVTAIGGGTLRDLLMGRQPIFWVDDQANLVVIVCAAAGTVTYTRFRQPPWSALLAADAVALAYFTIVGAYLAEQQKLSPLLVVVMGVITGSAGGVLRDVLSRQVPLLFQRTEPLYATAAAVGAATYLLVRRCADDPRAAAWAGMAVVAAVRFASIRWGWRLPAYRVERHRGL